MTKNEALKAIDESPVRPYQQWKHWKTNGVYTVIAVAIDEPTLTPIVVYAGGDGVVWTRYLDVFLGRTDQGVPRFWLMTETHHTHDSSMPVGAA